MYLVDLQIKLDDLYKLRAEGAFIRSRQRWLEHGEQMSTYFFKLEKNRAKHNSICQLNIGGVVSENLKEISQFCYKFYSNLYKSKFNLADLDTFRKHLGNVKTISHDDQILCDSPISIDEVKDSISQLKINKSPGSDGITAEFY